MNKFLALFFCILVSLGTSFAESEGRDWRSNLFIPTYIGKHADQYFIVACWQHRILTSKNLNESLDDWVSLDEYVSGSHSLAFNGNALITESTGSNGLVVYRRGTDGSFERVQVLENMPQRPHRIVWDEENACFWMLASNNQIIYQLVDSNEEIKVVFRAKLNFLEGRYTRSFTLNRGFFYFISGAGRIVVADFIENKFEVINEYKLPAGFRDQGGMNDIFQTSDGWWYLTFTSNSKIIRTRNLDELSNGGYEDVTDVLGIIGTPYYLSEFDGRIWVPVIYDQNGIVSFNHDEFGNILDVFEFMMFPKGDEIDEERKSKFPQ